MCAREGLLQQPEAQRIEVKSCEACAIASSRSENIRPQFALLLSPAAISTTGQMFSVWAQEIA